VAFHPVGKERIASGIPGYISWNPRPYAVVPVVAAQWMDRAIYVPAGAAHEDQNDARYSAMIARRMISGSRVHFERSAMALARYSCMTSSVTAIK